MTQQVVEYMSGSFKSLMEKILRHSGYIVGGLASMATIVGLWVSVKTLRQTERIHVETQMLNQQMNRREQIRQSRECIEKYLVWSWYSKAVQESNRLNDSLRVWNMVLDSTCYFQLDFMRIRYEKSKNDGALQIVLEQMELLR